MTIYLNPLDKEREINVDGDRSCDPKAVRDHIDSIYAYGHLLDSVEIALFPQTTIVIQAELNS